LNSSEFKPLRAAGEASRRAGGQTMDPKMRSVAPSAPLAPRPLARLLLARLLLSRLLLARVLLARVPLSRLPLSRVPRTFAPTALRALRSLAARRRPVPVDSRVGPRLRVAGGWPRFELRFGADVFPLLDVSEEGFQIALDDGATAPERARASVRRDGVERQNGIARRVWTGPLSAGYRFETGASLGPEALFAGPRSVERLRRRLHL
jgi:hypothetical protein